MPKTKKFIDRKKSVTFNLVHRSQRDPLAADESAPQRVLVPVNANIPERKEKEPELTLEQRKVEQQKYGIYYNDDYNYLQHLKDTKEVTLLLQPKVEHKKKEKKPQNKAEKNTFLDTITLPKSVLPSEVEEDVGLLNKSVMQGLCVNVDPEVVAALDEDFDFEDPDNQLEDNFIELAMGEGENDCIEEDDEEDYDSDRALASDLDLDSDDDSESKEKTVEKKKVPTWEERKQAKLKSMYSMTSNTTNRSEALKLLDRRFEKFMEQYDDMEIGSLDMDDTDGYVSNTHEMMMEAIEEFENSKNNIQLDRDEETIARTKQISQIHGDTEDEMVRMEIKPKMQWDCQSILSTRSNLYNRPKLLEDPMMPKKIKVNPKTGIPRDTLDGKKKLTAKTLARFNEMNHDEDDESEDDTKTLAETMRTHLTTLSIRDKNETPEEKKERKQCLKEFRRQRRVEKKCVKQSFKKDQLQQKQVEMNKRMNLQGKKLNVL